MGDRRPYRRPSWRVREAIGLRPHHPQRDDEFMRRMESGGFSPDTMARMAELLRRNGPQLPPGDERDD